MAGALLERAGVEGPSVGWARRLEALPQTFKSSQRRAIRAKIHSPIADNNPIAANTNQIFHGA
ncbi:MAG: hypothetical protein RIT45_1418 [Pseudomonadota bacterium]